MKWTTIEYIHQHSRIDFNCEDALLELYANAAEDVILDICRRTYEDFIGEYGKIPPAIRQATLMLVEVSYNHRSPDAIQNVYVRPYTFDMLVKPYMRLSDRPSERHSSLTNVVLGSDFKMVLPVSIEEAGDDVKLSDLDFSVTVINNDQKDVSVTIEKDSCTVDDDENTITVYLNSDDLNIGLLVAKVSLSIPDEEYPGGVRRSVQRVNPYIRITG